MRKCLDLARLAVVGFALSSCYNGTGSGDGGQGSDAGDEDGAIFLVPGCEKLEEYCLGGDFWVDWGIVSSLVCQETFECTNEFYEGDSDCRNRVALVLECAANLADESGCQECEDLALEISYNCDYPEECLSD